MNSSNDINTDDFTNVIKLISSNQKLSNQLILNTMKQNYEVEDYWKYICEKVAITDQFIIDHINTVNTVNVLFLMKYQQIGSDVLNNYKFILKIIDLGIINDAIKYQSFTNDTIINFINNAFIDDDFWKIVSKYQVLSNDFIRNYDSKLDWSFISLYQNIDIDLITDYTHLINWSNLPLNVYTSTLFNNTTIKLFADFPIWNNIGCIRSLSNDTLEYYFDKLETDAIINILNYREISYKFLLNIINKFGNDIKVWQAICSSQSNYLNESLITSYKNLIDWNELSENYDFSSNELVKYNNYINYNKLSFNDNFNEEWLNPLHNNNKTNNNVKNDLNLDHLIEYSMIDLNIINNFKNNLY